jgi:glycosyltransferase involved in cell wall biosynthesis
MKIFSIIVPVFNEEKTILEILKNLKNLNFSNFKKEIIIVDDGSTDNTKKILNENKEMYDSLFLNDFNKGKGAAVILGLKNSKGSYVVIQDADLEYDPQDLIKFEKVFQKFDADGIIGSRFSFDKYTRSHNILNKFANFLLTLLFNILYNTTFTDIYSCYFAFKKNLLNLDNLKVDGFAQHAEILTSVIKKGTKFYEVPINYDGRSFEEGKKIKFYHFVPVVFQIFIGKFK